ncbi:hypothetical protein MUG10_02135 [Xanthomonas prunicola]|uniref:Uncharacterized protein n=1 Tax=Xanthomonas prunicola TaxID=2053930 RepID=A0A9Q9MT51_9XANT|nr:hypothetical protein [Xanthomonas prunicola]MEB2182189.1 hypothetical protein [Xanthomonas campestris pv. campestris]USJ01071.1 hypothetical protein MUG10_02135 [Xanthomonas prunicola]UXA49594.1 hypothetical protein M0D44_03210 [Xanthomonas prunicola]UXA60042.1 hypothetical protein M0D48_13490 [Xanthomonas prunicola]UXA66104.1 hypothetical protein M0D43_03415 [Xanthomonas prunicola]
MTEYIDFVKKEILNYFSEKKANVGHVLHPPAFNFQRVMNWNPKQKEALDAAISQLVDEGIVEEKNGTIALTKKGVDSIY